MKRKMTLVLLVFAAICGIGAAMFGGYGARPFADLKEKDIRSVTVFLEPPGVTLTVEGDVTGEVAAALNSVVLYGKDRVNEPLAGQNVQFTILKTDGAQSVVQPFGSLITVDGVRYKTNRAASEKLSRIANTLNSRRQGG